MVAESKPHLRQLERKIFTAAELPFCNDYPKRRTRKMRDIAVGTKRLHLCVLGRNLPLFAFIKLGKPVKTRTLRNL